MSKLTAIVLTAAICLPLGALLQGSASADRRRNTLPGDLGVRHRRLLTQPVAEIAGHRQLTRAQDALYEAFDAIEASRREGEGIWSDTNGRASAIRSSIEDAVSTIDRTAAWVNSGTFVNDSRAR